MRFVGVVVAIVAKMMTPSKCRQKLMQHNTQFFSSQMEQQNNIMDKDNRPCIYEMKQFSYQNENENETRRTKTEKKSVEKTEWKQIKLKCHMNLCNALSYKMSSINLSISVLHPSSCKKCLSVCLFVICPFCFRRKWKAKKNTEKAQSIYSLDVK